MFKCLWWPPISQECKVMNINPVTADIIYQDRSDEVEKVEQFIKDILKGDVFPMPQLIQIAPNHYQVSDGNTRVTAYKRLGKCFDADVCYSTIRRNKNV